MKRGKWLAFGLVLACGGEEAVSPVPVRPPLVTVTPSQKVTQAVDSLNAALRLLYREGGKLDYINVHYPDFVPTAAPQVYVVIAR